MQQKAIYQLCLVIGISLLATSCLKKRTDYVLEGEFRYVNQLADTVQVRIRNGYYKDFDAYTILPHSVLSLKTSSEYSRQKAEPEAYRPAIGGDTTTFIFNDTLCYSEYHYSGNNLHNIARYTYDRHGDRDYLFYFIIDSALVKQARRCR